MIPRLMNEKDCMEYLSMTRTKFREWVAETGARRNFGRSVRYDRIVIDKYLDQMSEQVKKGDD